MSAANSYDAQKPVTVFYHDPCTDGAVSAWAAYKKWGDSANYIGIDHTSPEKLTQKIKEHLTPETTAVFADFCPPPDILKTTADFALAVEVYDHHKSAIDAMEGFTHPKVTLTMVEDTSGSRILWNSLFKEMPVPLCIELAEAIDLEKTDYPDFYKITAYIDSLKTENIQQIIEVFDSINQQTAEQIAELGEPIRSRQLPAIGAAFASVQWKKMKILPDGEEVAVPVFKGSIRELGREFSIRMKELAEEKNTVAMCYHLNGGGNVWVSVRSSGNPPANKVAEYIGKTHGLNGGGHRKSAAMQFTPEQFEKLFGIDISMNCSPQHPALPISIESETRRNSLQI